MCEEGLKKAAGAPWRASVVKMPHSSADLFKGVVESSCQLAKPVLIHSSPVYLYVFCLHDFFTPSI